MLTHNLKHHPILFRVSQLPQRRLTGKLDHGRWTAHEALRLFGISKQQVLFKHFLAQKSRVVLPFFVGVGRPVDRVPERKPIAKVPRQRLELVAHENVVDRLVGVNEIDARRRVAGVAKNGVQQLEHGGDAGPAGHHGNLAAGAVFEGFAEWFGGELAVSLPFQVSLGTLDEDAVANFERIQMLAHFASAGEFGVDTGTIDLDDQVDLTERCIV